MVGCASSLLASLYCSWRELLYVSANRCNLSMVRYIDDLIHARKSPQHSILHCIDYGIEFGSIEANLSKAPFVGITIVNSAPPSTCAYDRRLAFNCDIIRLPHAASSLAAHTSPAIMCGALCRAWAVSSSRSSFAEQACLATLRLAARMNPLAIVKRGWGLFLRRLEPSFIAEERLTRIKVCCLALAALSEPDRSVHLSRLESQAFSRQQSSLADISSFVAPPIGSPPGNKHGIVNHGHTCYAAVCLHLAASLQDLLPDLLTSLDIVAQVRSTRCSVALPPVVPSISFLESLSDSPLQNNCLLDVMDAFIAQNSLQNYLNFDTLQSSTCNGCIRHFSSESTGNILYVEANPGSRSCLSTLVSVALKDTSTVSYHCPCGSSQKRLSIEIVRVSSTLMIGFKRALPNSNKNHACIVTPRSLSILNRSFSLKAVGFHHGLTANNGHYTCLVEATNGWLFCNDDEVSPISNVNDFLAQDHYSSSAMFWVFSFNPHGAFRSPIITRAQSRARLRVREALAVSASGPSQNTRRGAHTASFPSTTSTSTSTTATTTFTTTSTSTSTTTTTTSTTT